MRFLETLIMKLWKWYNGHDGVANAHHEPYTDAEVDVIVATHRAISDAHHTKYTDADVVATLANATKIGIGTASPEYVLHLYSTTDPLLLKIEGDGIYSALRFFSYRNTNNTHGLFNCRAARGSKASPVQCLGSDQLFSIRVNALDSNLTTWCNIAAIEFMSDGNHGAGSTPGRIQFDTTPSGSTTKQARLTIRHTGMVGVGTTSPLALLDINSDKVRLRTAKTPASAGAAGNQGDICWDANYVYVCTSTNTWKRSGLTTW